MTAPADDDDTIDQDALAAEGEAPMAGGSEGGGGGGGEKAKTTRTTLPPNGRP